MAKFEYISEKRGDVIHLTSNEYFDLINIDGQTAAAADVSSVVTGGVDGDTVNNVQAQPRSIVLDLRIKNGVDVEEVKREILKIIKPKQYGYLVWEQNDRTVKIKGLVESIDMPRWNNAVLMQITLHCENPFWEDIDDVIQAITAFINTHYFTDNPADMLYFPEEGIAFGMYDTYRAKTFKNEGDVSVGIQIEIIAVDTVTNPIIADMDGNFFGVGYGDGDKKVVMNAGDIIVITTHKGDKTVKLNGLSVFDKIKPYSKWLQLQTGDNQFVVNSDDEHVDNMVFNLTYKQRYV